MQFIMLVQRDEVKLEILAAHKEHKMLDRRTFCAGISVLVSGCPNVRTSTETPVYQPDDYFPDLIIENRSQSNVTAKVKLDPNGNEEPWEKSYSTESSERIVEKKLSSVGERGQVLASTAELETTKEYGQLDQNRGISVIIADDEINISYRVN